MSQYRPLDQVLGEMDSPSVMMRDLFEHSPLGLQIYRADGLCIHVNPAFLQMFGAAPPADYKPLEDELVRESGLLELHKKVFGGEPVRYPVTWYDPRELKHVRVTEGNRIAIEARGYPVFDRQGQVSHVVFLFQDVTSQQQEIEERHKVVKRLNDANSLIRYLLDGTQAVIFCKALDGKLLLINRQYERVVGLSSEEIIGRTEKDFLPRGTAEEFSKADRQVIETRQSMEFTEEFFHPDGSRHVYLSLKFPLFDSVGKLYGICGIASDITRSLELEQELSSARRMEALGLLAGGIAHDFNNILGVILLHCDLVPGTDAIRKAALRASDLTHKLLAFGRQQVLAPRTLDLGEELEQMSETLQRLAGADVKVSLELEEGPSLIEADPSQLEQMMINLVLNARDAMPRGGNLTISTREAQLTATTPAHRRIGARPGSYCELEVRDWGVGMAPEVLERVFEPFFTTKEKQGGTGLGLASLYGIVQQSGGDIAIASEPGKGTTFRIYLPRSAPVAPQAPTSKSPLAPEPREDNSARVLVVDDENELREVLSMHLQAEGFDVRQAGSAEEAEVLVRGAAQPFDVIICDIIMPKVSGPELISHLRAEGALGATEVLFVSGYSGKKLEGHAFSPETTSFLAKPFSGAQLVKRLRELLAHAKELK